MSECAKRRVWEAREQPSNPHHKQTQARPGQARPVSCEAKANHVT